MKNLILFLLFLFSNIDLVAGKVSAKQRREILKEQEARKLAKQKKKKIPTKVGKKTSNVKKLDTPISDLTLLDSVDALVYSVEPEKGQMNTGIITMQDCIRQGFDGQQYSIDQMVDFELMDQMAKNYKIDVTTDDINNHMRKNGLSQAQVSHIAKENWFESVDDFYDLIKKNFRGRRGMDFQIMSQAVALESEIKNYYDQNPIWLEPAYFVETVFIPLEGKAFEQLKKEIVQKEKRNKLSDLDWDPVVKVIASEIGDNNKFIFDLKVGQSYYKDAEDGLLIYRLQNKEEKRKQSFEDRKKEISNKLRMEKAIEAEKKEIQNLRSNALIVKPENKI